MHIWEFTALVAIGSFLAGLPGALTGLRGGVVLIPLLTLLFKVDIRYAIGASLVSVAERDRMYAAFTALVLAILLYSPVESS